MNARVHEKVLVLFRELFNATTIFLQLRHFLLDDFQEVHVGLFIMLFISSSEKCQKKPNGAKNEI